VARHLVHAKFVTELHHTELDAAKLLVSELVTNAVLHGQGMITLRADLDRNRLRVDVIDEGRGFDRAVRKRDFDSLGGRGLHIVDLESSRWGVHEGTTHVWFELERSGPRLDAD
jgi:anti-sigma regulatory factor (Ser/Thr protein kinase)